MVIKISERLRPFSHTPGTFCIIPKSDVEVQIFPVLLRFKDKDFPLPLKGPIKDFTVTLDLEKARVQVFGHSPDGHFNYTLSQTPSGIELDFKGKKEVIINSSPYDLSSIERLSLGMSKAQDWDLVRRRADLKEILPVWFCLGQMVPEVTDCKSFSGTLALLEKCQNLEVDSFLNLFHAGFHGIMAPRLFDDQFHGISSEVKDTNVSPLLLLKKGAKTIRSLFFQEKEDKLYILPSLPPEFHAGRLMGLHDSSGNRIDLEWSKKILRSMVVRAKEDGCIHFQFQKKIKTYRLRRSLKDRGRVMQASDPLQVQAGQTLYLDRFQK